MRVGSGTVSLTRTVIVGNWARYGGGVGIYGVVESRNPADSPATIANCTIAHNIAQTSGGGISTTGPGTTTAIANTIVWGNSIGGIYGQDSTVVAVDHSIDQGELPWPGPGNINVDPLFVDPESGDYRLQAGSPAIDAGDAALNDPDGSRADIGAIPFGQPPLTVADGARPSAISLSAAPNPFNPSTTVRFTVPHSSRVQLAIYDVSGRHVRMLVDEPRGVGTYAAVWNGADASGRDVASGVYLVRLETPTQTVTQRITLLR